MVHQAPEVLSLKYGVIMSLNFLPATSPTLVPNTKEWLLPPMKTCPEGESLEQTIFAWLHSYQAYCRGQWLFSSIQHY